MGEVLRHALTHGPAHHSPGIEVDHDRKIEPAFVGAYGGDVTSPGPIRLVDRKPPAQDILRHGVRMTTIGGGLEASANTGS